MVFSVPKERMVSKIQIFLKSNRTYCVSDCLLRNNNRCAYKSMINEF